MLGTWAQFMDCPEVETKAINFIAVDWPSQQVGEAANNLWGGRAEESLARTVSALLLPAFPGEPAVQRSR